MIGHVYIPDEGGGGAYFLDPAGNLCHAPLEGDRYDWDNATQIDTYDIMDPDPGWDFARWARDRLADAVIDRWEEERDRCPSCDTILRDDEGTLCSPCQALPSHASGICPNCEQWQHKSSGDCLHECKHRGLA